MTDRPVADGQVADGKGGGPLAGLVGLTFWGAALAALFIVVADSPGPREYPPLPVYPPAPRGDTVDDYHGMPVPDPWRWLEDMDSPATRAWVSAENEVTARYLGRLPDRNRFASRLRALLDYERRGVPDRENGVYVYAWNPGQAEQDALRVTRNLAEPGRVLVDPAVMRADGTASIAGFKLSPDGSRLAYGVSDGGSDWTTWHIRDVATGVDAPEALVGIKFTAMSWARDGSGFYYSRYPQGDSGYDDRKQVSVYFHVPGTSQADDPLVYAITDHATRDPYATVTEDGRFLVFNIEDGYVTNGIYYRRLDSPRRNPRVVRLLDAWDARYEFLGAVGDAFYLLTTNGAPRGRVIAVDLAVPEPARWREVVPQDTDAIESAALIGGRLVVQYISDVHAKLRIVRLDGSGASDVQLPGKGTVSGLYGLPDDPEGYLSYTDFTTPRRVYRLDARSGAVTPTGAKSRGVDSAVYVSEQVFYASRDGTRVPMTIVRRRDVRPDGQAPTVLYGYGGFNVALLPAYSASRMAWIEAGGVYAQANLRGGGEYGEDWHLAGTRLNKQNVFDDFIGAAEWLIGNGITSPAHLAIWGGSNGGLLVGAVLNQRPELFAAAVPSVGVMDMLRYQTASLNARKWSSDYGLSENPEEFAALRAYSPYHNIRSGLCYPAVLVQADANDDRVVAWHSYKYAAALQAAQSAAGDCRRPVLVRVETRSGHGAGASVSKTVNEYADQWAFVAAVTGLHP
ncbi:MAG: prolyl oligopeptidase family serine peptidase [Gammaproteobacteria bacterium]